MKKKRREKGNASEPKGLKIALISISQHLFVATTVAKGRHIILLAVRPHGLYAAHLLEAVAVGGSETTRKASSSINLYLCTQHNNGQ